MKAGTSRAIALVLIIGMLASVVLAGVVSFYASPDPDGLEAVAQSQGFDETAQDSASADSALADYGVEGVSDERLSVGLAGVVGVGVTALVGFGLFLLLSAGRAAPSPAGDGADTTSSRPADPSSHG